MAKFCSNCGAPLEDGQEVCLKCGHITNKNFGDNLKIL
jgi:predicted nucleic acid-binding Zn ribbon protein